MATLVLTAIGTAIGGPIGGAIGALAGQAADALIFKPGGREGPRLSDLQVQTSRYGEALPRIFGRMRVAGTVIWSTDLIEATSDTDGGKGQPSVTRYSYSASFAVALSARRIANIGRIWADGNLLRGSAGDFKVPLGAFRQHNGAAGQAVDPLIAAAVGIDVAPAFRDIAYMVFEDLQLADFGNRIPSLTFEVIADEAPVPLSGIASALLDRPVPFLGGGEPLVAGYAAEGGDCEAALAPLVEAHGLRWRCEGDGLALVNALEGGRSLTAHATLRTAEGRLEPPISRRCVPLDQVPVRLSVRHFDPDRDYQAGLQMTERAGAGLRTEEIGLPALLSADAARSLAHAGLRRQLQGRRTMARAFGWAALDLKVGDLVSVEGEGGSWIVEALEWEAMAARLTLRSHGTGMALPPTGDAGHPVLQPDVTHGPTSLAAVELPPLDGRLAELPLVFAGATGSSAGWRRAALFRYLPETEMAVPIGSSAPRAILGTALTSLASGTPWTIDQLHHVDIALENEADTLVGVDDQALLGGANLCALGPELLLFGSAIPIGPSQYRLSRLIRGWRGTEWACDRHEVGEHFILIDPARLAPIPTSLAEIGRTMMLRAVGMSDVTPAEAEIMIDGRSIRPPAPVHGEARQDGTGALLFRWTRRSRLGWSWPDGTDAPIGEEREAYMVAVATDDGLLRTVETGLPEWTYGAANHAADLILSEGVPIHIAIRQIGTHGLSHPLIIDLP